MTAQVKSEPVPASYLALIAQRPLVPIRDDADYDAAVAMMYAFDRQLARGERDEDDAELAYFRVLTMLLEAYDDEHYPMPVSSTNVAD